MNIPGDHDPRPDVRKYTVQERMLFKNRIEDLMMGVAEKLSGKARSIQMMRDDNFILRTYTRHVLDMDTMPSDK